MENLLDLTMLQSINELYWHEPFYAIMYVVCLISLAAFWKTMKRGRRFFLLFSVFCLVIFIYNPVFVNLITKYLLRIDRVTVRLFLLLPIFSTESYVFTSLIRASHKKSRILALALAIAIVSMLFAFGVTPYQREKVGYGVDMYALAENPYKIPQEHIDICDTILNDMDGERTTLSLYEFHGYNDTGGTLNYSVRMYTSRIQLSTLISLADYSELSFEERIEYWNSYLNEIQNNGTDSTSYYFLFPFGDGRAADLMASGSFVELPTASTTYQLLVYTP